MLFRSSFQFFFYSLCFGLTDVAIDAQKARYQECNGLDLASFLITPVQRIPRYVMLLQDLFRNTPDSHTDYSNLNKALEKMRDVAEYVNEKKRVAENLNQVNAVQEALGRKIEVSFPTLSFPPS